MNEEPPIIDFARKIPSKVIARKHFLTSNAAFYSDEHDAKERLVHQIRQACERFGFFQLINHAIPAELQNAVLKHSSDFFNLPLETKEKYNQGTNTPNEFDRTSSPNQKLAASTEATSVCARKTSKNEQKVTSKKAFT
jgi:isopenicillin N synthase-like dioxygenase